MTAFFANSFVRRIPALAAALFLWTAAASAQTVPPDQAADMLLTSAKTAYNAKDFAFAAGRFREFLAKFGNHKDAAAAALRPGPVADRRPRQGLQRRRRTAPERWSTPKNLPDYPFYVYYLGLAQRGQGVKALAQIAAKPNEAPQLKDQARGRFDEAVKQFAAAVAAFAGRVKAPDPDAKELPVDLEWAARARCDVAEMQLRLLRPKEARDAVGSVHRGQASRQEPLPRPRPLLLRFRVVPTQGRPRGRPVAQPAGPVHRSGIRYARPLPVGPRPPQRRRTRRRRRPSTRA